MKTIGIFSDTHSYINPALYTFFKDCDELWHAGDWGNLNDYFKVKEFKPLKTVYGNIDGPEFKNHMPDVLQFVCEDLNICILHIGGYPGKYSKQFKQVLENYNPDIMICGHSHILKIINDPVRKILNINPGAAGNHGFHTKPTAIKLIINNKKPSELKVWEGSK
jgi:putative phosphoesterase